MNGANLAHRTKASFMDFSGLWGLLFLCPCPGGKSGLKIRHLGGRKADIIREMDEGKKLGERWIKDGLYEHTQYLYKYQFIINIFI